MPEHCGRSGWILRVNLTDGSIRRESSDAYDEWIGGRGLGAYLLSRHPELENPDPAVQPVAICEGPLVGSGLPMGTRTAVTARNLISGGMSYSNVGGSFGECLKSAGYDAVLLEGCSSRPVCLYISPDAARILPAEHLWGQTIPEVKQSLEADFPDEQLGFLAIGPAGERQVRVSCLMVDEAHAAGWGGSGAIFGAKRLKAVIVSGSQPIPLHDAQGLRAKARALQERINRSEAMRQLAAGGTHGIAGAGGNHGLAAQAARNIQDEYVPSELAAAIGEQAFLEWETGRSGCPGCSIRCLHCYRLAETAFGMLEGEGMHANSVRGLGSNVGVFDPQALFAAHLLCNAYGLDVDGVSSSIAFAFECAERGLLERTQPDGLVLEWGNGPAVVELVRQIGERRGLGELLGGGVHHAAQAIGGDAFDAGVTVKRVGINDQGIRSHRAWALGIMTSTRGGGHLGGSPNTENRRVPAELAEKLLGVPAAGDPSSYAGKGRLVARTESLKAAVDSLGLCYFVYGWYDITLGDPAELAEMLALATGKLLTGEQMLRHGQRVHALERILNYRLGGFSRPDDRLPDRFFDDPVSEGPYKGERLDRARMEQALDEYYEALGWNKATGLPDEELLDDLCLGYLLHPE